MVEISDCFHYIIIFVMLCNKIGWHNLQVRQVSGKFADCAVQFANWQIGPNIHKSWQKGLQQTDMRKSALQTQLIVAAWIRKTQRQAGEKKGREKQQKHVVDW